MSKNNQSNSDPNLKTLTILGLAVAIPVLLLLLKWAVVPNKVPPSRNLFISGQ